METEKLAAMVDVFEGLEDWRNAQQTRHRLSELLTVAVCAVLSGADDFEEISQWGRAKLPWLRGFLRLEYGVPSPDTFERVFALLDPKQFEQAFRTWAGAIIPALGKDQVIAIDGKSSRRTTSKAAAAPLRLRPTWAWYWARRRPRRSPTRSRPFPNCSRCSTSRAASSPSMRWVRRPRSPAPSASAAHTTCCV